MQQGWYDLLTDVADRGGRRFGGLGPFSPQEVATLIGNAFIGAEALLLLGFDRHRCRSAPACAASASSIRRRCEEPTASRDARERTDEAAPARRPGDVERDGVGSTGSVRRRRADDRAAPDVVDHPVPALEAAGALPRPAPPRRHVRRPRHRPVRPARRVQQPTRIESSPPTRSPCSTPPAPTRRARRACRAATLWGDPARRRPPRAGARPGRHRSGGAARRPASPSAASTRSTSRSTTTEGWAKYNRHYWERDYRGLPRVLLRPDVHRAALHQADRGLRRLGTRDRRRRR